MNMLRIAGAIAAVALVLPLSAAPAHAADPEPGVITGHITDESGAAGAATVSAGREADGDGALASAAAQPRTHAEIASTRVYTEGLVVVHSR